MGKFDAVPLDKDTKILFELEAKLGDYDVLYQKWSWEGISAESMIFETADLHGLTNEKIEQEVKSSPLLTPNSKITISHESGFTFVNFNFLSDS